MPRKLSHSDLLQLKRWNTPTIYNGWEQITRHDRTGPYYNIEETRDFMPQMGSMVGYAVTVICEPGNPAHFAQKAQAVQAYREYIASIPGPKIVIVQDLDKPLHIGSFWGEVNANVHKALGCVGTITDGCIRDVDEMTNAGFKAIAGRMCVGHAYSTPIRWDCEVKVFGTIIKPGDLIHADKHGFLIIPEDDQPEILEAVLFMDANECNTVIPAARESTGKSMKEILEALQKAGKIFGQRALEKFGRRGEW